jgi:hypothetical protein
MKRVVRRRACRKPEPADDYVTEVLEHLQRVRRWSGTVNADKTEQRLWRMLTGYLSKLSLPEDA